MRLRATMVRVSWDFDIDCKKEERMLDIEEIEGAEEELWLGEIEDDELWISKNYYREDERKYNETFGIAFEVVEFGKEDYENDDLSMYLTNSGLASPYNELKYNKESNLWFQIPRIGLNKYENRNEFKKFNIGFDISGAGYVLVNDKSNGKTIYKSPKVLFLPKSMDLKDYNSMVMDLVLLKDKIVTSYISKLGLGLDKSLSISDIRKKVNDLEKILSSINKKPAQKLVKESSYQKIRPNTKVTKEALIDKYIHRYRNKHKIPSYEESSNVYENQVIKISLVKLKSALNRYIDSMDKLYLFDLENKRESIFSNKDRILISNKSTSEEQIKFTYKKYKEDKHFRRNNSSKTNNYIDDIVLPFIALNSKLEKIDKTIKEIQDKKNKASTIIKDLDKLLNLKFLKESKEVNETIRPTQIFLKDKSYRLVWDIINNIDKEVSFLNVDLRGEVLSLKKLWNIYELWVYFKMIDILSEDMGWEIQEDLKSKVTDILQGIDRSISLKHSIPGDKEIDLKVYYNQEIEGVKNLIPDYTFEFVTPKGEFNVYLDAKYRDYSSQSSRVFYRDIEDVAYEKYIKNFEDSENKATASFIVHCDRLPEYTNFGGFFDRNRYNFKNKKLFNSPSHRYGAFEFTPSNKENFVLWFKMIMEYQLGYFKTCWECGEHENIEIKEKETRGGLIKYHMHCENCDSFWVKNHCEKDNSHNLVKHINSYHHGGDSSKDIWWAECPECSDGRLEV